MVKDNIPVWMWYPGDYEIYHALKQNTRREERGFRWPAYWKMDSWHVNVRFSAVYRLEKEEEITVYASGIGYMRINGKKQKLEGRHVLKPGEVKIEIMVADFTSLPAVFVEGNKVFSGSQWTVDDYAEDEAFAGWNSFYTDPGVKPDEPPYVYRKCETLQIQEYPGGVLADFGKEIMAGFILESGQLPATVCYGESLTEALDIEGCYYSDCIQELDVPCSTKAYRYVFLPGQSISKIKCSAVLEELQQEIKGFFFSADEELNQIWQVAAYTFRLNSRIFFLDGVKRDQWIWSGDAYQSYFINRYLCNDKSINERTILALRGRDPVTQHINTIVDYSLFWIIGVYDHYMAYGDMEFLMKLYPKMESLMKYTLLSRNEEGFLVGRKKDWIFIDWADFDREGPLFPLQILLVKALEVLASCQRILGQDSKEWMSEYNSMKTKVLERYWCEEKGAFVDSFLSGKRHISRHGNIFAILFGYIEEEKTVKIIENVLQNSEVPSITTPYFKFYELEALCMCGFHQSVYEEMKRYWGGMLKLGATTFWEEYRECDEGTEHLAMYGDPYGKSLAHAWGATPIYILGRYFAGVYPLTPGFATFAVEPIIGVLEQFECVVPVGDGSVRVKVSGREVIVITDRNGGRLLVGDTSHELEAGKEYYVKL